MFYLRVVVKELFMYSNANPLIEYNRAPSLLLDAFFFSVPLLPLPAQSKKELLLYGLSLGHSSSICISSKMPNMYRSTHLPNTMLNHNFIRIVSLYTMLYEKAILPYYSVLKCFLLGTKISSIYRMQFVI